MPTYYQEHETEAVYTKAIEVDKKMVPIVAWLNSYENVYTLFCCEGAGEKKRSYVSFISVWDQEATEIIDVIKDFTWNAKYNKVDGIIYTEEVILCQNQLRMVNQLRLEK